MCGLAVKGYVIAHYRAVNEITANNAVLANRNFIVHVCLVKDAGPEADFRFPSDETIVIDLNFVTEINSPGEKAKRTDANSVTDPRWFVVVRLMSDPRTESNCRIAGKDGARMNPRCVVPIDPCHRATFL